MEISYKIFKLIIRLIGKLSVENMEELLGKNDAKTLGDWYYEKRMKMPKTDENDFMVGQPE